MRSLIEAVDLKIDHLRLIGLRPGRGLPAFLRLAIGIDEPCRNGAFFLGAEANQFGFQIQRRVLGQHFGRQSQIAESEVLRTFHSHVDHVQGDVGFAGELFAQPAAASAGQAARPKSVKT